MARRHHYRRNPRFFGVDVEQIASIVSGASFTQFLDAQFLQPLVGRFTPSDGSTPQGRAVDGVTTIAAAKGTRMIAELVGLRRYAADAELGGYAIGGAKLVSTVVPSVTLTATYPGALGRFGLGGFGGRPAAAPIAPAAAMPALPARAASTQVPMPAGPMLAGTVTAWSQPANVSDDAGI
jgi:hypothetical protein